MAEGTPHAPALSQAQSTRDLGRDPVPSSPVLHGVPGDVGPGAGRLGWDWLGWDWIR